jgi:hypothetical protein
LSVIGPEQDDVGVDEETTCYNLTLSATRHDSVACMKMLEQGEPIPGDP